MHFFFLSLWTFKMFYWISTISHVIPSYPYVISREQNHTNLGSSKYMDVLVESQGSKVCFICFLMSPTLLVSTKSNVEWSSFSEFWDGWIMRFYALWQNLSGALNFISDSKFCLHFDWICCMKFQVNVWCYLAENDELMSGWNKNQWVLLVSYKWTVCNIG